MLGAFFQVEKRPLSRAAYVLNAGLTADAGRATLGPGFRVGPTLGGNVVTRIERLLDSGKLLRSTLGSVGGLVALVITGTELKDSSGVVILAKQLQLSIVESMEEYDNAQASIPVQVFGRNEQAKAGLARPGF